MAKKVAKLSVVGTEIARDDIDQMLAMAGTTPDGEDDGDQILAELEAHIAGEDENDEMATPDEVEMRERMTSKRRPEPKERFEVEEMLEVAKSPVGVPGGFKSGIHNLITILNNDPKLAGAIGLDLFSGSVRILRSVKFGVRDVMDIRVHRDGQDFNRNHEAAIMAYLGAPEDTGGWGISVKPEVLQRAIINAAHLNAFDPLIDLITSVKWDGVQRLDTAWSRWMGLPDNAYHRQVSRNFMVAFVQRRFRPGADFPHVPVFIGKIQGIGKTLFAETLSLGRFGEFRTPQEFSDPKKIIEASQDASIMEIPEFAATMYLNDNVIKSMLSAKKDRARGAYANAAETVLRRFLMIATSNDETPLKDPSGNRRLWPIYLKATTADPINIELMREEIQQVYAEALVVYREMYAAAGNDRDLDLRLTGDAARIALELQDKATTETGANAIAGWLTEWLATPAHAKFATVEIDGQTYRDRFCLKEAFEAYSSNDAMDAPTKYGTAEAKLMSDAVKLMRFVSKGQVSRFEKHGSQASYAVDPDWIRAQVAADRQPEPETSARPENVISIAASKPVSVFEDWNEAEAEFAKIEHHEAEFEAECAELEAGMTDEQRAAADAAINAVPVPAPKPAKTHAHAEWDAIEAEMAADASKT